MRTSKMVNIRFESKCSFDRATAVVDMRYGGYPAADEWYVGMKMTISDVWCLLLGVYVEDEASSCLGLVLTKAIEHGENKFRRVGMFTINGGGGKAFKNCDNSDVVLI